MGMNCDKKKCNSLFVKGMTAVKKQQPNNHIPNQKKTRKVVV